MGSARWRVNSRATATITSPGPRGATAVSFEVNSAKSFTVNNDGLIIPLAPPGNGVAIATVPIAVDTSPTVAGNIVTGIDSDFEGEVRSWRAPEALPLDTLFAYSGAFSLQGAPPREGTESVEMRSVCRADSSARYWRVGPEPAKTGPRQDFVAFNDSTGALTVVAERPVVTSSSSAFNGVAETTVSPVGTASAALGV